MSQKYDKLLDEEDIQIETQENLSIGGTNDKDIIIYGYRYVMLLIFTLNLVVSGFIMIGFSAITNPLAEAFGISPQIITYGVMAYFMMYIPINFISNWVIDNYGAAPAIRIAGFFTLAGAWFRILYNIVDDYNFTYVFIGQIIGAIGQPFILNSPTKLSSTWFGVEQRGMATAVGSLGIPIGVVVGFVVPSFFISGNQPKEEALNNFNTYLWIQNYFSVLPCLAALFFSKANPPTPTSNEAKRQTVATKLSFLQQLKSLLLNRDYVFLVCAYSLTYGLYMTLGAIVGQLTAAFNYTESQASIFGAAFIMTGLVGAFGHGIMLDKFQKYKFQLIVSTMGTAIAFTGITFIIGLENFALTIVFLALIGFFIIPILPVGYSFAVEISYPVGEAQCLGIMITIAQLSSTGMSAVIAGLLDDSFGKEPQKMLALYIIIGIAVTGFLCSLVVREKLNKTNAMKDSIAISMIRSPDTSQDETSEGYKRPGNRIQSITTNSTQQTSRDQL